MKIDSEKITIVNATVDNALDWAKAFLKSMTSFRWMNRYLKSLNISELDVKISFEQDLVKNKDELFVMAYYENIPIGIIRASEYWLDKIHIIPSHYPLVLPRFQRKGVGELLVKEIIKRTIAKGDNEIWAETWSKDKRELQIFESFYEKIDFDLKSNRSEMNCSLEKFSYDKNINIPNLKIINESDATSDFVTALSKSYSDSQDNLHRIERIYNKNTCKKYVKKLSRSFQKMGYALFYHTAFISGKLCAALMTATAPSKGIIMEIGVVPEFRKRKIGNRLVLDYLKELKSKEINEATLAVDMNNIPAINLYLKLGFKHDWFGKMFLLKLSKDLKAKISS